jgi:hypothetical protein
MAPHSKKTSDDIADPRTCIVVRRGGRVRLCLAAILLFSASACGTSAGSQTPDASPGNTPGGGGTSDNDGSGSGSSSGAGSEGGGSQVGAEAGESGTTDTDSGPGSSGAGSDAAGIADGSQTGTEGGDASSDGASGGGGCTRDGLTAAIDAYYVALAAHDPSKAPLSSTVKYTENGMQVTVGNGEWKTAGAVKFKRSALDTQICTSVTESVIADTSGDLVYGLRLKLVSQQITEIETIPVHSGQYITISASGLVSTSSDNWEAVLAANQQATRDQLQTFIDTYFTRFPNGACNFASDCMRVEDGASIGSCTGFGVGCSDSGSGTAAMTARLHVLDVEAGIAVGFTMFAGTYTDFHMFKIRGGQVHGVHAVLASATSSGWN